MAHGGRVFDFTKTHQGLRIPTVVLSTIAQAIGAEVLEQRPGRFIVQLPDPDQRLEVRVRLADVEHDARAVYHKLGRPLPSYLQPPPDDDDLK